MADSAASLVRPRIIAGFGRSGTTWVQDALAEANQLRPVFEPLHPDLMDGAARFAHVYREAGDRDTELAEFLKPFFDGRFHSLWADYRIRFDTMWRRDGVPGVVRHLFKAGANYRRFRRQRRHPFRIVKFVRANMMLAWLKYTFDARIVFIVRHPAAVVLSQMKGREVWKPWARLNRYRADHRLLGQLNDQTRILLDSDLSDIDAVTLSWCIENSIAIRQAIDSGICIVFYEDLLHRGDIEWQRVIDALGLEMVPDEELISRPSQQAASKSSNSDKTFRPAHWMSRMDDRTSAKVQRILDLTNVDLYKVDDDQPTSLRGLAAKNGSNG